MIIEDVISLAKYSELSGVATKDNTDAVVAFLNLGLLELYTRFPIKIEEHIVALETGKELYTMPTDFMYHTAVYGEVDEQSTEDNKLAVNDEDDPYSVFFINWNTLQVPDSLTGEYLSVMYIAKPSRITAELATDGVTELDLPDTLVDALLSYVGYRAHLGVKSDAQSENNAHWRRFELNCKKASDLGVAFPSDTMNMPGRINSRGFK